MFRNDLCILLIVVLCFFFYHVFVIILLFASVWTMEDLTDSLKKVSISTAFNRLWI